MDEATSIRIVAGIALFGICGFGAYLLYVVRKSLKLVHWVAIALFVAFLVATVIWYEQPASDDEEAYQDDFQCVAPPC